MKPSPGVTSIEIIRIQVFFLWLCQKYLTFLLGLCQFTQEKRPEYLTFCVKRIYLAKMFKLTDYSFSFLLVTSVAEAFGLPSLVTLLFW